MVVEICLNWWNEVGVNFNEVLKLFFLIIQKMLSGRKNGLSITEWLMIFLTLYPPLYYIDAIAKNFTTAVWCETRRSNSCFLYLLCVFYYTENLKWTKMLSFNSYKLKALLQKQLPKIFTKFPGKHLWWSFNVQLYTGIALPHLFY